MGGYAMTSVVGLVLVAMTGLTITNHHRNQNTATGKSLGDAGAGGVLLQSGQSHRDASLPPEEEQNAKELERALAKEDEALWASYERYQQQQQQKHPRNVRLQKDTRMGHAAATDPMVNSVYSLNTKSELAMEEEDAAAKLVVRRATDDSDPSGLRALPVTTTTAKATGGDGIESTTTDGEQQQEEQRPFDFYDPSLTAVQKREYVKKMMIHAWDNYKLYAWGKNELRPLSKRGHTGSVFGMYDFGATIVDGLDTLYLMGLQSQFDDGKDWVQKRFTFENASIDISVFETNIRFVGGFLTLYALTGDAMWKDKAQYVADKLLPAFQTPTGIPMALVNLKNGMSKNYNWASGGSSILSEFGTLHLEFAYLSDITGNPVYRQKVENIRTILKELEKPKGLYPNYLNPKTGKWGQQHMSMGALGDSYFEYLLKAWIQSGQTDDEAREMYDEAMKPIIEHMVRKSPNGLVYVSDLKYERLEHKMDHLACFAGGLFALGAHTLPMHPMAQQYLDIGTGVTNTCHESYIRTQTHLGPESFRFSESVEAKALKNQEKYYILRPETFESYFIMWRLTHDQKYRDWGWDAVKALETYCRTPFGYSGVKNVYLEDPIKDDVQQSFFLAETLKYLYLLFSDDDVLPLDQWVFNTEAHPLPVKGANEYYRAAPVSSVVAEPSSSEVGN